MAPHKPCMPLRKRGTPESGYILKEILSSGTRYPSFNAGLPKHVLPSTEEGHHKYLMSLYKRRVYRMLYFLK